MPSVFATQTATNAISESATSMIERGRSLFDSFGEGKLQWLPELQIGWYPVSAQPYDKSYFEKYRSYDATPTGELLTDCRLDLVYRHHLGSVVDIGVGGGKFVAAHRDARGFDINPEAVAWLQWTEKWVDPYSSIVEAATFWDSLEHIHDPRPLLRNVRRFCFVSLPIFKDCSHILRSKHYRKDEHCWYFTRRGIEIFMRAAGFRQIEQNKMEQACGREDIETFVFERP
jgi:hypothetical protein